MQAVEMKSRLVERVKALEAEKSVLLEEIGQLKEVVELSEKAKSLQNEVNKLKKEVETLKDRIPQELLKELSGVASPLLGETEEEKASDEECLNCEEEECL